MPLGAAYGDTIEIGDAKLTYIGKGAARPAGGAARRGAAWRGAAQRGAVRRGVAEHGAAQRVQHEDWTLLHVWTRKMKIRRAKQY